MLTSWNIIEHIFIFLTLSALTRRIGIRGYPPSPSISEIMGLAKNSPQNPAVKELRYQNP
jgi:hypothetical protein